VTTSGSEPATAISALAAPASSKASPAMPANLIPNNITGFVSMANQFGTK
jgi:hypothetical protein